MSSIIQFSNNLDIYKPDLIPGDITKFINKLIFWKK